MNSQELKNPSAATDGLEDHYCKDHNSRKDVIIIANIGKKCNDKNTQCRKIVSYIEEHGSIDAWRAMSDLHIMRLASRVHDLRSDGINVVGVMRTRVADDGSIKRWKEYSIR